MKQVQEYLVKNGVTPSVQRLTIMDYLLKHRTHPTVDEIHADLQPLIPTLSKTTVYNTLRLFVEHKVALFVDIDEKQARFDGDVNPHIHFRCRKCGCILDIPLPDSQFLFLEKTDLLIEETSINIKGLCKACKN